ncbi:MAG TPA: L,D-transpeptidase family protein [Bacillota bacterium]|nr:L,D-transpeptidase family protein [Bacillota bacterium]
MKKYNRVIGGIMNWLLIFVFSVSLFLMNPSTSFADKEIIINLWHRTLKVQEDGKVIHTYKVGPGSRDTPTPMGVFKVINKSKNWGSGFGSRWMEINVPWGIYGIHGTNKPGLIGRYVSHGCIRMKNKDVEQLYKLVKVGTKVTIDGPLTGHKDLTYRILVLGSKGTLVQIVQNRLKSAGYYKGVSHGKFDRLTEIAVTRYQKANKLPVTMQIHYEDLLQLGIIE